jgi:hypothetical protein
MASKIRCSQCEQFIAIDDAARSLAFIQCPHCLTHHKIKQSEKTKQPDAPLPFDTLDDFGDPLDEDPFSGSLPSMEELSQDVVGTSDYWTAAAMAQPTSNGPIHKSEKLEASNFPEKSGRSGNQVRSATPLAVSNAEISRSSNLPIVLGSLFGVTLLVGLVGLAAWFVFGRLDGDDAGGNGDADASSRNALVELSQPSESAAIHSTFVKPPLLVPLQDFTPSKRPGKIKPHPGTNPLAHSPSAKQADATAGLWEPLPENLFEPPKDPLVFDTNLAFPIEEAGLAAITMTNEPVAVFLLKNTVQKYSDVQNPKTYKIEILEQPNTEHFVVNLSTGKKLGHFHWRSPATMAPKLSPDGRYLVGPDPFLNLDPKSKKHAEMKFEAPPTDRSFGVFVHKKPNPKHWLSMPGDVVWMDFLTPTVLAMRTHDPKPLLQFWNVDTGKLVRAIPLSIEEIPERMDGLANAQFYRPYGVAVAVSPNRELMAVLGADGIAIVGIRAGKQLATIPHPRIASQREIRGMNFSADGRELYVAWDAAPFNFGLKAPRMDVWSLVEGTLLAQTKFDIPIPFAIPGPLFNGTMDQSIVFGAFNIKNAQASLFSVAGQPISLSAMIELGTGSCVTGFPYQIIHQDSKGNKLAYSSFLSTPPRIPFPESFIPAEIRKDPAAVKEFLERNTQLHNVVYVEPHVVNEALEQEYAPMFQALLPRPKASPIQRDQAKLVALESPAKPLALSDFTVTQAKPLATQQLARWPDTFAGEKSAVVSYDFKAKPRALHEVSFQSFDWKTSEPAMKKAKLWNWAMPVNDERDYYVRSNVFGGDKPPLKTVCSLSPDGERIALVDPSKDNRLDVFDSEGHRLAGMVFSDSDSPIDHVLWCIPDKIHLLSEGSVIALDAKSLQTEWIVQGNFTSEVTPQARPGGIVVWGDDGFRLLDPKTGATLFHGKSSGETLGFTISPNGKKIAASFLDGGLAIGKAVVWDLESGEGQSFPFGKEAVRGIYFVSNEHLLTIAHKAELFDLKLGVMSCAYAIPEYLARLIDFYPFQTTPDGSLWWINQIGPHEDGFQPIQLPNFHQDGYLSDPDRKYFDFKELPVQVNCSIQNKTISEAWGKVIMESVQSQGFAIGPNGWKLNLQSSVEDDRGVNVSLSYMGVEMKRPVLKISATLVSPSGEQVWQAPQSSIGWDMASSRYRVRGGHRRAAIPNTEVYDFDFEGKSPRAAILEELLEISSKQPPGVYLPTSQGIQVGDKFHPFQPNPPAWKYEKLEKPQGLTTPQNSNTN